MITVVIPLYNKENQIANTLQTVLKQTFQDFEIVIVNDGSTDNSIVETEKIRDSRIRIVHQKNAGVSAARNKGIEEAKYDLVAFLDADDEWKPEYLETQYKLYLKYPECSVFAVNYEFRDSKGKITPTKINKLPFTDEEGILSNYFKVASCSHPPLWTSAVMIRKNALKSIGGFPIGIKSGEDLLTWAKLAVKYKIAFTKQVVSIYNFDEFSFNQNPREPEVIDIVGQEFVSLYNRTLNSEIKLYIAFWHKIRASVYMRFNKRLNIYNEIFLSLKYNRYNIKLYAYIIIALFPINIRKRIFC